MPSPALEQLIDDLASGGLPRDGDYSLLSDLPRDTGAWLSDGWKKIPTEGRITILERAAELAELNVELDFSTLGQVALEDPSAEVREKAVLALWEAESRELPGRLSHLLLHDENPGVRAAAAKGLFRFVEAYVLDRLSREVGEPVVETLRQAAGNYGEAVDVRAAAIESLGPSPEQWAADLIGDAYETGDPTLQLAALRAMGYSGQDRWEEYISEQLNSGDPEFRFEAVLAAANLGSEELVPSIGELLADEEPEVVLAAVEALGEIGGEEAQELLLEFRAHVPAGMEESLELALETAATGGLFRRFGDLDEE